MSLCRNLGTDPGIMLTEDDRSSMPALVVLDFHSLQIRKDGETKLVSRDIHAIREAILGTA